jgi:hypothetical protein
MHLLMAYMNWIKSTSGYIFKGLLLLLLLPSGSLSGQDTLRTYGPRIGVDLASFVYYFTKPAKIGAEFSADFEVYKNIFPVFEAGYSTLSDSVDRSKYRSGGPYARVGIDYNVLPLKDRSIHHSLDIGIRYAASAFKHQAENITVPSDYWGDYTIDEHENTLTGHWLEIVGGIKAEVLTNFFIGWSIRYKILINPNMDPQITPLLIPGYGKGTDNRTIGFTYSLSYKIPLLKR